MHVTGNDKSVHVVLYEIYQYTCSEEDVNLCVIHEKSFFFKNIKAFCTLSKKISDETHQVDNFFTN